jgi:hypothetical protein
MSKKPEKKLVPVYRTAPTSTLHVSVTLDITAMTDTEVRAVGRYLNNVLREHPLMRSMKFEVLGRDDEYRIEF